MQRFIIILAAAVAGILVYFAIAPNIDNDNTEREPRDQRAPADQATSSQETSATSSESAEEAAVTAEEAELSGEARYSIRGTSEHPASGNVRVIQTPGEQIIRFENYEGTDGPDLRVYLANELDATDPVDLGPSRARSGNINYGVPIDVDIDAYQYVLTWSEEENVLYDYAQIH